MSINDDYIEVDYIEVCKYECFPFASESTPGFGIKILIAAGRDLTDGEKSLIHNCVDKIKKQVLSNSVLADPKRQEIAREEKEKILACFPDSVYVKEIPNGYCNDYCCVHRPWFLVTTAVGEIKIGWRKRVIQIEWDNSELTGNANDYFEKEDTTKYGKMIHAWGYDKAKEYLTRLIKGAF